MKTATNLLPLLQSLSFATHTSGRFSIPYRFMEMSLTAHGLRPYCYTKLIKMAAHFMHLLSWQQYNSTCTLLVGASMSEPLSSHLNVNFVCLSVRLYVMDRPYTINHFRLLFCYVLHHVLIEKPLESWRHETMDSLTPQWQQQGWRPLTDLPIHWLER